VVDDELLHRLADLGGDGERALDAALLVAVREPSVALTYWALA
jgi:hypothetical protein